MKDGHNLPGGWFVVAIFYGLYQPGNVMPLDIHNRSEILKKIQNGGYQI